MPEQLIKNRQLADNAWRNFNLPQGATLADCALPDAQTIIPGEMWLLRREEFLCRSGAIAVSLAPTFKVETLADDIAHFALICIEFPKFADGRGYSLARLLRERYGYRKELRAVGDVGRDQMFYLHRVGFDAFLIPAGRDAHDALNAFADFPDAYQAATDQPLPLFRRRAA